MAIMHRIFLNSRHLGLQSSSERRLLRLVLQLCLVLLLFNQVSNPKFWASWISNRGFVSEDSNPPGTRLIQPKQNGPQLPLGMVTTDSPQSKTTENSNEGQTPTTKLPGLNPLREAPVKTPEADLPFLMETLTDLDRDLPPALYYHFLDKAQKAPTSQLIRDGRSDITFAHLYRDPREDPKKFRGELIRIEGTVRRALAFDIPENAYGLEKRYELWVFTEDSGKYPWVVELTDLPKEFPLGTEIQAKIQTSGYFLKLWAYRAQDGFRSAPVLLGHGLEWTKSDEIRVAFNNQFRWILGGFLGLFGVILTVMVTRWLKDDFRMRKSQNFGNLTDRFFGIPNRLDLNDRVFPAEEFDYIVQKTGEDSKDEVLPTSHSLEPEPSDTRPSSAPEELNL